MTDERRNHVAFPGFQLEKHVGIVLDVGEDVDCKGASFACAFPHEDGRVYLFYSAARDADYRESTICLAVSTDGMHFDKIGKILENQEDGFCQSSALTPAVFEGDGGYYMLLAGASEEHVSRKIGTAKSSNLEGPWRVAREVLEPRDAWEGNDIDLGPGICTESMTAYYSNVSREHPSGKALSRLGTARRRIIKEKWWQGLVRRLGVLELRPSEEGFTLRRHPGNPLSHLNGSRSNWNESLFCPGYAKWKAVHLLFSASSNYSIGPPFRQYLGVTRGESPYFGRESRMEKLIDGHLERDSLFPKVIDEIALDTPSPILMDNKLWLYYGVMDRHDGIWRTALSIFRIPEE